MLQYKAIFIANAELNSLLDEMNRRSLNFVSHAYLPSSSGFSVIYQEPDSPEYQAAYPEALATLIKQETKKVYRVNVLPYRSSKLKNTKHENAKSTKKRS